MDANLMTLIEVAKKEIGVKEDPIGSNCGARIEEYQRAVDGRANAESWCMCFVQFLVKEVEKANKVKSLLFRSESCMTVWERSPIEMRRESPSPGCIAIWQLGNSRAGHTGIVTEVLKDGKFTSVEGNTTIDKGIIREGFGVFFKTRSLKTTQSFKLKGFLKAF